MTEAEITLVIDSIAGNIFELFQKDMPTDASNYYLNEEILACAVRDASTDINRVGSYHSKTGANVFKKAAHIAKWLAEAKPIQINRMHPVNLTNHYNLNDLRINSIFAVYVVEALIGDMEMYNKLRTDLRYCFIFRPRMDADSIAMLLEHALEHAPARCIQSK